MILALVFFPAFFLELWSGLRSRHTFAASEAAFFIVFGVRPADGAAGRMT